MDPIKQICRLCLDFASLSNTSIEDSTVREKMHTIFNFALESKSTLPSRICTACLAKINEFYSFSEAVRSNQKQLMLDGSMISYDEIKVEPDLPLGSDVSSDHTEPIPVEPDEPPKHEIEFKQVESGSEESEDDVRSAKEESCEEKANRFQEENRKIKEYFSLACETCDESFDTLQELRRHCRQIHNKPTVIKCCGREMIYKRKILEHINKHLGMNPFRCDECDKSYADKKGLRQHIFEKHTAYEEMTFKCDHCPRSFSKAPLLKAHQRAHLQVECSICKKVVSDAAMRKHMLNIHGGNSHICETCGASFRSKSTLDHHVKNIHLGLVPKAERVQCDICSKWVSNRYNLMAHFKVVHSGEPIECDVCSQPFSTQRLLLNHKKRVHLEKFECEICSKKFMLLGNLKKHRASHTCHQTKDSYKRKT